MQNMQEQNEVETENFIGFIIEEKGDLAHAIRCTRQAMERADRPWLKRACACRIKMLQVQLSKQKNI